MAILFAFEPISIGPDAAVKLGIRTLATAGALALRQPRLRRQTNARSCSNKLGQSRVSSKVDAGLAVHRRSDAIGSTCIVIMSILLE